MGPIELFVGNYLPYITVAVLVIGILSRVARWWTAPLHLKWELYPHPETQGSRLREMIIEILSIRSLFTHNRKMWYASYPFHGGLYLLVLWFILMLIGVPKGIHVYIAATGAILTFIGAVALLAVRSFNRELRADSTFVEYFNLAIILAIVATGLYVGISGVPIGVREYILGLIILAPNTPADPVFLTSSLLLMIFAMYLPFSRMIHFVAKYFTIDKVKWGE